jgi:hypothetical protein
MHARLLIILAAVATALTACLAPPQPGTSPFEGAPTQPSEENGMPDHTEPHATPSAADHDALVQSARQDLAEQLTVAPDDIEVTTVRAVTWPDGSMGCPEPGQMYTQALVDGAYIELAHDGDAYAYHWGQGLPEPFLCERSDGPPRTADS